MRRLEYAGRGQIVDARTKNLVSPRRIVSDFNLMADALARFGVDISAPKPQTEQQKEGM